LILRGGKFDARLARLAACAMLVAVAASALQTIPLAEYGRHAVRWVGADHPLSFNETVPYSVHEEFALPPLSLLSIIMPNIQQTFSPFVGIAAFGLGILGAILGWRERQVQWLAAVSLGGIVFSLGPASLLHGVLYALVPLVEKARVPAAAVVVFAVGFAPLVAYGVDLLPQPENFGWSRRLGWWLVGATAVLTLIEIVLWAAKKNGANDDRVMITVIAAASLAAILAAWRAGSISVRAGTVACIALALFELANVNNYELPNIAVAAQNPYLRHMTEHGDLAAYIRNRGEAARAEFDAKEVPYDIGDWYGIETSQAFDATVLANIWGMDIFSQRLKNFFGVRYYVGKAAPSPEYLDVFTGRSGLKIFENIAAYPRVWSVHEAASIPDASGMNRGMAAPGFNPRRTALLTGEAAPPLGGCRTLEEDIQMPYHAANRLTINANLQCKGMVILSDAWYPGWRATVDGKPARIYEVYGGVRGVIAEAGKHVIEMRYRPWSILTGGALTLIAAFLALLAAVGRIPFHAV
jgi:hypothetical protein